jgi:DeoR family transcriptional regulator, aga operon transcriptional repressor
MAPLKSGPLPSRHSARPDRGSGTAAAMPNPLHKRQLADRSLPPQRRQDILDLIVQRGQLDVNEISQLFGVSKVTARGDLDYLARNHLVERARGGAVVSLDRSLALNFSQRAQINRDAKQSIASAALAFLSPRETIILDAGSTVFEFSGRLSISDGLTVVTPALNIATKVGSLVGLELIIIGGRLDADTISSVGTIADHQLGDLLAHKLFLGVHAVDAQGDLADVSTDVANLKRCMIKAAREVILLADSTKWDVARQAKAKVAPLSSVNTVITDAGIDEGARRRMEAQGINVVVA